MFKKQIGINSDELQEIISRVESQPQNWRKERDKEADYIDNYQLDSAAMELQRQRGITTPSIDNLIAQQVRDACSIAEENRKDAKLTQQPDAPKDLVDGLAEKLRQAEEESMCDRACLEAHRPQAGVGLGWVEVFRHDDPFGPKYLCRPVSRNEIWWDMSGTRISSIDDAEWMLRRRWVHKSTAIQAFPKKKREIEALCKSGNVAAQMLFSWGGDSTGLVSGRPDELREWSIEEQQWLDTDSDKICIYEPIVKKRTMGYAAFFPNGHIREINQNNQRDLSLLLDPDVKVRRVPVTKLEQSFFIGPIKVGSRILPTRKYPYVPFYYWVEDLTGIPYGMARLMISLQDEHNARLSSYIWGLGAVRTVRTEGIVAMKDEIFRQTIARRDADIVLKASEANKPGARFDVERDYNLNQQQYQRTGDIRDAIRAAGGAGDAMQGSAGIGNAEAQRVGYELASKSISRLSGIYEDQRVEVLNRLLDMIIEDAAETENERVVIPKRMMSPAREVTLNAVVVEEDGTETLTNDVRLYKGHVRLEDVPSSPERSKQELISLSELGKSLPGHFQQVIALSILSLSSLPFKDELAEQLQQAAQMPTEEEIEQRIKEAVEAALVKAGVEQKKRELDIKEVESIAKAAKLKAETANVRVETVYSGTQAALGVVSNPQVAPVTQEIVDSAGFEDQNAAPVMSAAAGAAGQSVPAPIPEQGQPVQPLQTVPETQEVRKNTSPMFPPRPQAPAESILDEPVTGKLAEADIGAMTGIEKQGNQQKIEEV